MYLPCSVLCATHDHLVEAQRATAGQTAHAQQTQPKRNPVRSLFLAHEVLAVFLYRFLLAKGSYFAERRLNAHEARELKGTSGT